MPKIWLRKLGNNSRFKMSCWLYDRIGIPTENREKLFQPFFTTKPTLRGHWAWAVHQLRDRNATARRHHVVDSEAGDFSEFTVRLPPRRHAVVGRIG
jgi:hypothetical protein